MCISSTIGDMIIKCTYSLFCFRCRSDRLNFSHNHRTDKNVTIETYVYHLTKPQVYPAYRQSSMSSYRKPDDYSLQKKKCPDFGLVLVSRLQVFS